MSEQRTSVELNDVEYNYFRYYRIKPSEENTQKIDAIIKIKASDTNPMNPRLAQDLKNDAEEIMVYDAVYDKRKNKYNRNKGGRNSERISLKRLSLQNALGFLFGTSKSPKVVLPSMIQNIVGSSENRIQNENIFSFDELVKEAEEKGFWVLKDDALDKLMQEDDGFALFDGLDDEYRILNCGNLYEFLGVPYSASENEITQAKAKKVEEGKNIPARNMKNKSKKKAYSTLNARVGLVLQNQKKRKMYDLFVGFYSDIWSVFKDKKHFNNFDLSFDDFAKYVSLISKKNSLPLEKAGRILLIGVRHYSLNLKFGNEEEKIELTVQEMISKAEVLIDDGKYDEATPLLNKILYKKAKNGRAYFLELLVEYHCGEDELKNILEPLDQNENYLHAYKYGDANLQKLLDSINDEILLRLNQLYASAMNLKNERRYQEACHAFQRIYRYQDADGQANECAILQGKEDLYQQGLYAKNAGYYADAISIFKQIRDYRDSLSQINICQRRNNELIYNDAMRLKSQNNYKKAISLFESIKAYKDSSSQISFCTEMLGKENIYRRALDYKSKKMYQQAISEFKKIEDYRDSKKQIESVETLIRDEQYGKAVSYMNSGMYDDAIRIFTDNVSYKDSRNQIAECKRLKKAQQIKWRKKIFLTTSLSLVGVVTLFMILTFNVFIPSERESDIQYYLNNKQYDQAYKLIQKNGDFGDNKNLLAMCEAGKAFERSDFETGIDYIYNIGGIVDVNYDGNYRTTIKKKANQYLNEPSQKMGFTFKWSLLEYSLDSKSYSVILSLQGKWSAILNKLTVISENTTKGSVSILSGQGYTNEKITVKATVNSNYAFKGWYEGNQLLSRDETYTFMMPAGDKSLMACFWTKKEEDEYNSAISIGKIPNYLANTNTLTYGLYPQTHVSDVSLISTLDTLTTTESNGWYLYNGSYYAKKSASPEYPGYTFSDGTTIVSGTTYWFKCEPIEWKILSSDNGTYSLVSTVLLDAHQYHSSTSSRTTRTIDGKKVYSNNYKYSDIRSWLNDDFYNSAFSLDSSYILTTNVDNSASTTDSNTNPYACENTNDKVYLLSYKDYMNTTYFLHYFSRYCKPTDYAKANGGYWDDSTSSSYNGNGNYWTRSPYSLYSSSAWRVDIGGYLNDFSHVYNTQYGVRPAITIKI